MKPRARSCPISRSPLTRRLPNLVQALRQADGAVLFRTKVDEAVLAGCPRLKAIAFLTTGIGSWVDLDAAAQRGIVVRNVPGYADRTVAEHTLALIFACARRVAEMDRAMRRGSFQPLAYGELAARRSPSSESAA